jgi:hypothetical protein
MLRSITRAAGWRLPGLLAVWAGVLVGATGPVAAGADAPVPDSAPWSELLARYVTPSGVRYAAWQASGKDRMVLREWLAAMQSADPGTPAGPPAARSEALAFWINLYNAATIELVLEAYPIASLRDLADARTSPWQRPVATVGGRELSLDAIENEVIRPGFREPRIHFALNCAARSCPPLRPEAYTGPQLDTQLEAQTRAFLADPTHTRFDGRRLTLSRIFEWYGEDFAGEGAIVRWVRPWISALAALPADRDVDVHFGEYDWALNDAGAAAGAGNGQR